MEVIDTNSTVCSSRRRRRSRDESGSTIVKQFVDCSRARIPGIGKPTILEAGALDLLTRCAKVAPEGDSSDRLMPGATDTGSGTCCAKSGQRHKMMYAETVHVWMVNALLMPENTVVEKGILMSSAGPLYSTEEEYGMAKVAFSDANA